jgi:hypothetical protein
MAFLDFLYTRTFNGIVSAIWGFFFFKGVSSKSQWFLNWVPMVFQWILHLKKNRFSMEFQSPPVKLNGRSLNMSCGVCQLGFLIDTKTHTHLVKDHQRNTPAMISNTRVRIFIFFYQNLTLGYMTKTLNQIIFFFLHQNQNIFFSKIENQNIFLEKTHKNFSVLFVVELERSKKRRNQIAMVRQHIFHFTTCK